MPRPVHPALAFALLLVALPLEAQRSAETFDLSGLPPQPTTFLEQQIRELVAQHTPGDLASAAVIQRKLAQYYTQVGDSARARVAQERATEAEAASAGRAAHTDAPAPTPMTDLPVRAGMQRRAPGAQAETPQYQVGDTVEVEWSAKWYWAVVLEAQEGRYKIHYEGYDSRWDEWVPPSRLRRPSAEALASRPRPECSDNPPEHAVPGGFDGRYYRMEGTSSQTQWTFGRNGTYYYAHISGGYGTSVRTGERGWYTVEGEYLVLHPCREVTAFATPAVGGRDALIGGGAEAKSDVQRVRFKFVGRSPQDGIVLNGVTYQWRSW